MSMNKRGPKVKVLAPSGNFIALGSGTTTASTTTSSSTIKPPVKRDAPIVTAGPSVPKKSKLSSLSHHMTRSSGVIQLRRESGEHWEEFAVEVDPHQLLDKVFEAEDHIGDERVEALLCGAVKRLKNLKLKSNSSVELNVLYITLCYLAKTRPMLFCTEIVVEAFCSLLKRDPTVNFKAKGNSTNNTLISVLASNLLLAAYHDENCWPETFLRVFVEDSLGERNWVDHEDCKGFVDNILASFNTKMPPKSMLQQDVLQTVISLGKPNEMANSSPIHNPTQTQVEEHEDNSNITLMSAEMKEHLANISITTRFTHNEEFVNQFVSDIINDQLIRKQVISEISRNMLKFLAATSGIQSVRLIVSQKLEMWLQNAKLTRPAQDLLLTICLNCTEHDSEIIQNLVKLRPKTKPLTNHYMQCLKEMINSNNEIVQLLLKTVLYNELSPNKSMNNMGIISVVFQSQPEKATEVLAEVFHEMLAQKEDYLKSLRTLLREIVRTLRYEHINLQLFITKLTEESEIFHEIDSNDFAIREKAIHSIADLITLVMFLNISPAVREAISPLKPDRKVVRNFQMQIANIQRLAVIWLQNVAFKLFKPERNDYIHCLNKILYMESAENYYSKDNWPPENDRNFMLRMVSEVPLLEDTLIRVLNMGLSKDNFLTSGEAIELSDALIKRAFSIFDGDMTNPVLLISSKEIFPLLLKSASYRHPENISLPSNYEPPSMAIIEMYWKVWIQLLILTAHNPSSYGLMAWENYPTLAVLIEMSITNHFEFPPPSKQGEDLINRDLQIAAYEKQQILQFESHLAAASTKVQINEHNSLLLSKLISMDPHGPPRRPPSQILENFKVFSVNFRLGYLLCQCRNPDFLLEIIQRQQKQHVGLSTSSSMPWLVELVESNENNFGMLPVQCLCEFLLGHFGDEELNQSVECGKLEKNKKKEQEKRRKQLKLIAHLQNVINANPHASKELIDYFMKKFNSRQSSMRILALKTLALLLNIEINMNDENFNITLLSEIHYDNMKNWLLDKLPLTPNFRHFQVSICESLRQALLVETIPNLICVYIQFLSIYDVKGNADLSLQVANLLINRSFLVNVILEQNDLKAIFIDSISKIFQEHILNEMKSSDQSYSWENAQDYVLIQWKNKKIAKLNISVVQGNIVLLTFGLSENTKNIYEYLYKIWFSDSPQGFLVDTSEDALLFPDWLKLKMLKSSDQRLIVEALKDPDPSLLILAIQSYGIPKTSMELVLKCLDNATDDDSEAVRATIAPLDQNLIQKYIEVQWLKGIETGKKFAQFMGWNLDKTPIGLKVEDKKQNKEVKLNANGETKQDGKYFEKGIQQWIRHDEENHDNFLLKLTRQITQELFDKNIKSKSLTKLFLNQLTAKSSIDHLMTKFENGEMNSICNVIVTFTLKDVNHFGFDEELFKVKNNVINSKITNTTIRNVFERFNPRVKSEKKKH